MLGDVSVSLLLSRYSTVVEEDTQHYVPIFLRFAKFDGTLNENEAVLERSTVIDALQSVCSLNGDVLSETEQEYLLEMFDMRGEDGTAVKCATIKEFFIIAALAEKMAYISRSGKSLFGTSGSAKSVYEVSDVKQLKQNLKSLWVVNSPNTFGQIALSTLEISLRAGRMDDTSIRRIVNHFMSEAKESLDVLDFVAYVVFFKVRDTHTVSALSSRLPCHWLAHPSPQCNHRFRYMPFFNEMHDAVTEAPLSNEVRLLEASKMSFADQAFRDKRVDISRWRTLKRVFVSRRAFASVAHVAQTARRRNHKKARKKASMIEANKVRRSLVKAVSASKFASNGSKHLLPNLE